MAPIWIFGPNTFMSVTQTLCLITLQQPQSLTCHRQLEHQLWEDEEQRGCSKGKSSLQSMCRLKKALVQISTVDALISRKLLEYLEYTTRSLEVRVCMLVCVLYNICNRKMTSADRRKTADWLSLFFCWNFTPDFCSEKKDFISHL